MGTDRNPRKVEPLDLDKLERDYARAAINPIALIEDLFSECRSLRAKIGRTEDGRWER